MLVGKYKTQAYWLEARGRHQKSEICKLLTCPTRLLRAASFLLSVYCMHQSHLQGFFPGSRVRCIRLAAQTVQARSWQGLAMLLSIKLKTLLTVLLAGLRCLTSGSAGTATRLPE